MVHAAAAIAVQVLCSAVTMPSPPPQTFRFPDGSFYRGGVADGMQHGHGEWRSAEGDMYVGEFRRGTFEGRGRHADERGNVYEGEFLGGVFDGSGTYNHADGRADSSRYHTGREAGEGVRWSLSRERAWRLRDGAVADEISLDAAGEIAAALGLEVPSAVYTPPRGAAARLRSRIRDWADSGDEAALAFDGYVDVDAVARTTTRAGALVAHSVRPLVDSERCDAIVAECEARAERLGGWTTARHESYPTTDVPVAALPETLRWLRETLLPEIAWPFVAHAFGFALGGAPRDDAVGGGSSSVGGGAAEVARDADDDEEAGGLGSSPLADARCALRVSDAFIVKYNASAGQRLLAPHRDGCLFSFNVALNGLDEYEGGGTYFRALDEAGESASGGDDELQLFGAADDDEQIDLFGGDGGGGECDEADDDSGSGGGGGGDLGDEGDGPAAGALRSPKGHLVAHSSALMHGGHPTTAGVRYILVAFCTIDPAYGEWAARFYEHVKEAVDPRDEFGRPSEHARPLPRGLLSAGPVYREALNAVRG